MTFYIVFGRRDGTHGWRQADVSYPDLETLEASIPNSVPGLPDPNNLAVGTAMDTATNQALSTNSEQNIPIPLIQQAIEIVGGPVQTNSTAGLAENKNIPIVVVSPAAPPTPGVIQAPQLAAVTTPVTAQGVTSPGQTTPQPGIFSIVYPEDKKEDRETTDQEKKIRVVINQPQNGQGSGQQTSFDFSKIPTKTIVIFGAVIGIILLIVALIFRGRK